MQTNDAPRVQQKGWKIKIESESSSGSIQPCQSKRCIGKKTKIQAGQTFESLTAIQFFDRRKRKAFWLFECSCGIRKPIRADHVITGLTKSCGCKLRSNAIARNTTHGMFYSPEYRSWSHIKTRCLNEKCPEYKWYGGRGIAICDSWKESFVNFFTDMGERPSSKHSIDRINTNGNYCKENCRWATMQVQQNNKRNNRMIEFQNKTLTLAQWSSEVAIPYHTIKSRIDVLGWSVEKALTQPLIKYVKQKIH